MALPLCYSFFHFSLSLMDQLKAIIIGSNRAKREKEEKLKFQHDLFVLSFFILQRTQIFFICLIVENHRQFSGFNYENLIVISCII